MKLTKEEFTALLDRYLKGSSSAEEAKLLNQFFDSYHDKPGDVAEIRPEIKEEILLSIQARMGPDIRKVQGSSLPIWLRAAAAISFLLIASYSLFDQYLSPAKTNQPLAKIKEVRASRGQKLDIRLPDGSRVKLNANSRISYLEKLSGDTRDVTLDGEAYFDVSSNPSRPFIVHTQYASTKVLGTSFNVLVTPEATAITLVEGKVDVSVPTGQTASLVPNEQALISRESKNITTHQVDVEKYIEWKSNTLRFDDTSVREAFNTIENWYDVEIDVNDPALLDCVITSKYKNESLANVLNSFRFMLKMDFKIDGNHITVSGKGCR
jgi:ferric-dicitrate binding protein FerR (iron transport regulator)